MKIKEQGFSLIEMVIGLTVLSLISVAIGTSFLNIFSNQKKISDESTVISLDTALNNHFNSSEFCQNSLINFRVGNNARPLTIRNYRGFGSTNGNIRAGTNIDESVQINRLDVKINNDIPAVDSVFNNRPALSRMVDVSYGFRTRKAFAGAGSNANTDWIDRKPRNIMVSVKMRANGRIVSCEGANSLEAACIATGGRLVNGQCEPREFCQNQGNFIRWNCSGIRPDSPVTCGTSFTDVLDGRSQMPPVMGASSGGVPNPKTRRFRCPRGSTATFTGRDTHQYTLSCGKKCSYVVTQAADFFSCLKCD